MGNSVDFKWVFWLCLIAIVLAAIVGAMYLAPYLPEPVGQRTPDVLSTPVPQSNDNAQPVVMIVPSDEAHEDRLDLGYKAFLAVILFGVGVIGLVVIMGFANYFYQKAQKAREPVEEAKRPLVHMAVPPAEYRRIQYEWERKLRQLHQELTTLEMDLNRLRSQLAERTISKEEYVHDMVRIYDQLKFLEKHLIARNNADEETQLRLHHLEEMLGRRQASPDSTEQAHPLPDEICE